MPGNALGIDFYATFLPAWPGLAFHAQLFAADPGQTPVFVDTSNSVTVRKDF